MELERDGHVQGVFIAGWWRCQTRQRPEKLSEYNWLDFQGSGRPDWIESAGLGCWRGGGRGQRWRLLTRQTCALTFNPVLFSIKYLSGGHSAKLEAFNPCTLYETENSGVRVPLALAIWKEQLYLPTCGNSASDNWSKGELQPSETVFNGWA